MHVLANGYTVEKIDEALAKIISAIDTEENHVLGKDAVKLALGEIMALAYARGYADSLENKNTRLIF